MVEKSDDTKRVLIVTPDTLGLQMAGPAIRAFEMAKAVSRHAETRLVSSVACDLVAEGIDIHYADEERLRGDADWADVIVFQGHILASFPWMMDEKYILVADIYDPMHLEVLEQGRDLSEADRYWLSLQTTEVLNSQIERADFMLCASEKQRDFWLGHLASLSRINPATYAQDESLRTLLDVVPFGIGELEPTQSKRGIKGVVPGISENDTVILWGGGIYNWFDPLTLVRAVAELSTRHPDLRLYFLGVKHPNPNVPEMEVSYRTKRLAEELGILGSVVFFNEDWVPYEERADFLLDADLGISTHYEHLETAFSFRTRILDYIWASLPVVSTDGDTFATIIRENELGRVVPPEDVAALADAIEDVLYTEGAREAARENVRRYAERMRWSKVLKPLIDFCLSPRRAADLERRVRSVRRSTEDDLIVRIRGLEASTSWRITRPLRWVAEARLKRRRLG